MRKILLPILAALGLMAVTLVLFGIARGQVPVGDEVIAIETQGENTRAVYAPANSDLPSAPDIGFIDSPTAGCYQPDPAKDACYINWYYMSVSASPNYMITMTATLTTIGVVSRYHGFFQTSMYVPYNMQGNGFKVACGDLGAGGNPLLGNAYAWTIRAKDSAGLKSANYGTVYCPAFTP
jgi:hypothetical protein